MTTKNRAKRMPPGERKLLIFNCAIIIAKEIGYYNLTRVNVSNRAKVSIPLVNRYFKTVRKLKNDVLKYALQHSILEIIAQGVMTKDVLTRKLEPALKQEVIKKLIEQG